MPKSSNFTVPSDFTNTFAWLDVAMNDQIAVGMRHGVQHALEQPHSRPDIQSHALAVGVDGFAFHILEHQVWLRAFGDSRVQQPGDVRVVEPGECTAFEPKRCSPALPIHIA